MLNADGIITEGVRVKKGHTVLVERTHQKKDGAPRDTSELAPCDGQVRRVIVSHKDCRTVLVVIETMYELRCGDKLAVGGQKGTRARACVYPVSALWVCFA